MTYYVSVRPLILDNKMISPKRHLQMNFTGIKFTFEQVVFNSGIDGRMLYEINLSDEYSQAQADEYFAVILESLALFGGKVKTFEKAKELAQLVSKVQWEDNNGKIKPKKDK